jgi:hypothetical protein
MTLQNQLFRAAGKKSTVGLRKPAMDRLQKWGVHYYRDFRVNVKNILRFLCEYPVLDIKVKNFLSGIY